MSSNPSLETYQVIARKYRPQTFSDVIGQESIVTTLKNALRFKRLAHAYLFCGCRGTGKTTLARVFSKALNCQNLTESFEPCNQCLSCQEISQGRSLDVIEIDGASHRGIDDIRQINETISYASSSGKYKIYIIDEVHMLTKEAFNALLKTLEEPPSNVKFFFATTEPHKVLATIMSRCQRFDLSRITFPLIKEKLLKIAKDLGISVDEEAAELVARLSEGSLRDAESLFDQVLCYNEGTLSAEKVTSSLGITPLSTFFELDQAVEEQNFSFAFTLASKIFSTGKDLSYFLDSLLEHYRTILAYQLKQDSNLSSTHAKKYALSSEKIYSQEQTLYILDYLISSMQQIAKSSFKRINLEMILLHIIRSKKRLPLDTLVRRLHELQSSLEKSPAAHLPAKENDPKPAPSLNTASLKDQEPVFEIKKSQPLSEEKKPDSVPQTPLTVAPLPQPIKPNLNELDVLEIEFDALQTTPQTTSSSEIDVSKLDDDIQEFMNTPLISSEAQVTQKEAPVVSKSSEVVQKTDEIKPTKIAVEPSSAADKPVESKEQKTGLQKPQARHSTIIRFATVELEGVFSKQ